MKKNLQCFIILTMLCSFMGFSVFVIANLLAGIYRALGL